MVREALSDSMHLQKLIADEREEREYDVACLTKRAERGEVRLNALQAIMQTVSNGGRPAKRQRTLSSLAAQDPKWGRLLHDPDQLFSGDDIIDKAYKQYLSDVLALMVQHDCTFKHAVELSTERLGGDDACSAETTPARRAPSPPEEERPLESQ
eukprot:CAMPEP_0204519778 /NCGR_PEP_ID=MMETSP0661-20131031/4910_1 /ASSEMBLY_ACC=CAM_ASM_000606 /TAXON_ID=109239 /ORGANISM="Alexandrium margalefi, Strain AMGDE01CS-322" /LENGTH=153 /DNA_ID=CAMNT_0051525293 /DNA_START=1 /DNA_END=462 /DNA_ORIENTATION=-